jgi:hypothetical protein
MKQLERSNTQNEYSTSIKRGNTQSGNEVTDKKNDIEGLYIISKISSS